MAGKELRLLEILLHGAHQKEETLQRVARALGSPVSDFFWMMEPGENRTRYAIDTLVRNNGFRTQVTLGFYPQSRPSTTTNLEFAGLLARQFNDEALVLEDPMRPGVETFHGLLILPDGKVFRVPLKELPSEGMDIDRDPAHWSEWR